MFAGLISRCSVPVRCAVSSAPQSFTPIPQGFWPGYRPLPAQPHRQGIRGVVGHHDEWPVTGGHPDPQDVDDVRVPGQPAHRVALAQETFPALLVHVRRQQLDRDVSTQGRLVTAINHAGAAPGHLVRILESGGGQLRGDPAGYRRHAVGPGFFGHSLALNLPYIPLGELKSTSVTSREYLSAPFVIKPRVRPTQEDARVWRKPSGRARARMAI